MPVQAETLSGIHAIRFRLYYASASVEWKKWTCNPYIDTKLQKDDCQADIITNQNSPGHGNASPGLDDKNKEIRIKNPFDFKRVCVILFSSIMDEMV